MTIRSVVQTLDVGNELGEYSKDVREFGPELDELVRDLIDTMEHEKGLGLAAPQIGRMKRVFVIADDQRALGARVFVNPILLTHGGRLLPAKEGCLSLKHMPHGVVLRPHAVECVWLGVTGKRHVGRLIGLQARTFLHELDHLNGSVYLDRVVA